MPELPDLQVFSYNLNRQFKGKVLQKLSIRNGGRLKITAAVLNKQLAGKELKKVYRDGKQLVFFFGKGAVLNIHLMLHGKLVAFKNKDTEKHTVASLLFDDGTGLTVTDFQGMAQLALNPEESDVPDALSKKVTPAFLKGVFSAKHKMVKDLLLDQHIIRGIGNAYADEILWKAGISPFSYADKIPPAGVTKLAAAIKKVLTDAEKSIRKESPGIIAGEVRDFLLIHNSKRKLSPTGQRIQHTTGTRKTYYTKEQKLYK